MEPDKPEQTDVNTSGTVVDFDTGLTRECFRFELIDKDGNSWGFFDTATRASGFANRTWPDQEQDPDRTGQGWDVQVVGAAQ